MLEDGARRPPSYLEGASVSIKIILAIIYYYIAFYYGSDYVPNVASVIISVPVVLVVFVILLVVFIVFVILLVVLAMLVILLVVLAMLVTLLVVLAMLVILLVVFVVSVVVIPVVLGVTAVFRIFHVDVVNIFSVAPTYRTVEVIRFAETSPLTGRENVS